MGDGDGDREEQELWLDEALAETFPASDPLPPYAPETPRLSPSIGETPPESDVTSRRSSRAGPIPEIGIA